jgi:hypothetical protein
VNHSIRLIRQSGRMSGALKCSEAERVLSVNKSLGFNDPVNFCLQASSHRLRYDSYQFCVVGPEGFESYRERKPPHFFSVRGLS